MESMSLEDIESWFEADEYNPGYHVIAEDDIDNSVTGILESSERRRQTSAII